MSHEPVCSDWQFIHPLVFSHSLFQWTIHLYIRSCCSCCVCSADASSPLPTARSTSLQFVQLFATCFCNMQSFLWVWLSHTKCLLTSDCILSGIFYSNQSHSEFHSSLAVFLWLAICMQFTCQYLWVAMVFWLACLGRISCFHCFDQICT